MNRASLKSAETAFSGTPAATVTDAASEKIAAMSAETAEFLASVQAATKSGTAALNKAVHENPTLALAGLVAAGALTAIAFRHYRAKPQSMARRLQGDVIRQTRSVRKAVRDELRSSGLNDKFDHLGTSLAAIDWKPYIQPLIDRASGFADDAKAKINAASKS